MYSIPNDRCMRTRAASLLTVLLLAGCSRDTHTIDVAAPYGDGKVLAEIHATWSPSSETRAFAGAARLKETESRFQYRVNVRNRQGKKLLIRLSDFALTDKAGLEIGRDEKRAECVIGADGADALLSGEVWVPQRLAKAVHGFGIGRYAVPLEDKERTLYRDWLLKGRPDAAAEIDAEIARSAAAPPCALP